MTLRTLPSGGVLAVVLTASVLMSGCDSPSATDDSVATNLIGGYDAAAVARAVTLAATVARLGSGEVTETVAVRAFNVKGRIDTPE